jgi:CheY-like chemotaxis protein
MATILLVEDHAEVRSAMHRVLQRIGHGVVEASDGGEALRFLQRQSFDLVITDINMPGMDGIELILALNERWPDLPVIAVSGGGLLPKELLLDNARGLGVVHTLSKPVEVSSLQAAVEEALGSRPHP